MLSQSNIQQLDLAHCHLGPKAIATLHESTDWSLSKLRVLNLMNNSLGNGPDVEEYLKAMMAGNKRLRTLCGQGRTCRWFALPPPCVFTAAPCVFTAAFAVP